MAGDVGELVGKVARDGGCVDCRDVFFKHAVGEQGFVDRGGDFGGGGDSCVEKGFWAQNARVGFAELVGED